MKDVFFTILEFLVGLTPFAAAAFFLSRSKGKDSSRAEAPYDVEKAIQRLINETLIVMDRFLIADLCARISSRDYNDHIHLFCYDFGPGYGFEIVVFNSGDFSKFACSIRGRFSD